MVPHDHMIMRAEVRKPFTDPETVKTWLETLIKKLGMKITEHGGPHVDYVNEEGNKGIAAVAMISTSHIALHIWDQEEPAIAQLDVYSCKHFPAVKVIEAIEVMDPTRVEYHFVDRKWGIKLLEQVDRLC